jgi:hypothetical protein
VRLSRYLDDGLAVPDRRALERHLLDCAPCRRALGSLTCIRRALGAMREEPSPEIAAGVISALRAAPERNPQQGIIEPRPRTLRFGWAAPALALALSSFRDSLRGSLWRTRLRLTLPIGLLVGTILTLVNQGGMLLAGQIDARMCAVCGLDFLLPFVALNVVLAIAASFVGDRG